MQWQYSCLSRYIKDCFKRKDESYRENYQSHNKRLGTCWGHNFFYFYTDRRRRKMSEYEVNTYSACIQNDSLWIVIRHQINPIFCFRFCLNVQSSSYIQSKGKKERKKIIFEQKMYMKKQE